jgi:hypothetical protein
LQTTVTGPCVLSFWWKASTEEDLDFLECFVDGELQQSISGEVDWSQKVLSLDEGSHILKWAYYKDDSVGGGRDAGWVDQVVITVPSAPTIISSVSGGSLILSWTNGGAYNILTNSDLTNTNGWGIAVSGATSPATNPIGSSPRLFYKLSP